MRSYSFTCLSLLIAGTLACDPKGNGTDTSEISSGGSEGTDSTDGTDSASSTDGSATGEPETTTASPATGVESDTATSTSGYDPTDTDPTATTTMGSSSVGTSQSGSDTDDPPPLPEPEPCEGEAVEIDAAALSYLWSQLPPAPDPTGGSSGTGGDPTDPDTLYVRLSNLAESCDDLSFGLPCGPNWELTIVLPPAFQTPGLYHLLGPDVLGLAMETGPDEGGGVCSGGGGSFSATFELISVDDNEVKGRLCHVQQPFFDNKDVNLEGSFTAPRCK